ncbi:MAG: DUF2917 domain-containing protein [Burkholderiales bacterium]
MACMKQGTIVDLAAREAVPLRDVRGVTLRVTRGTLWVTQERDRQDIVLRPGDNWAVERSGLTLVQAQQDATFCVLGRFLDPELLPVRRRARSLAAVWQEVRAFAVAQFWAPMRRMVPHV